MKEEGDFMWKNPWLVLDKITNIGAGLIVQNNPFQRPYPDEKWEIALSNPGHEYFTRVFAELAVLLSQPNNRGRERIVLRDFLIKLAITIEDEKDYSIIPSIYAAHGELNKMDDNYQGIARLIPMTLRLLVGDEGRILIGTRGGKPAWKKLRRPISTRLRSDSPLFDYGVQQWMVFLDQSDVDLMPEPDKWIAGVDNIYDWPRVEIREVHQLMEDAYYNQRYIVHPEGAYVQLRHFGPLKSLTLKVKSPGLFDPNYVDFVVRFDIDSGQLDLRKSIYTPGDSKRNVLVFDGSLLTAQTRMHYSNEKMAKGHTYLQWVTALIYHDLVTATEIQLPGKPRKGRRVSKATSEDEQDEPSWIYIPRRIKKRPISPRADSGTSRFTTPHYVHGHRRKANPTDKHLKELEEFERQTGLKVLKLLRENPGYTFVRPHISPSADGIQFIPRFIHARLQSDIEQLMRGLPVSDN